MNKKIFMCSFCKRHQTEVKKLIVGPNVYICDFCTNICGEILHEEDINSNINNNKNITLTPQEIFNKLHEVVAGQVEAKKELAIGAYLHYLRMNEDLKNEKEKLNKNEVNSNNIDTNTKLKKYNMLLIGPTGSGKTLLMQTLAKILDVAYVIIDANSLTEAGYVGEDVEGIITKLFNSVYYDGHPNINECIRKTKYGFIFIDEIDKKYASEGAITNRDVSGKGVQQNLLKIIEGTEVQINNKKNPHQDPIIINTNSIFVVGGGAFQGLNNIIKQSTKHLFPMGFINKDNNNSGPISDNPDDIMKHFHREHLITFGMIPELVGRFECISILHKLTEEQLVEILRDKRNNLMEEYVKIFDLHNVSLIYEESLLHAIAKKALKDNTGARSLRSIVHKLFSEVIFTMPTICTPDKKFILAVKDIHLNNEKLVIQEVNNNENNNIPEEKLNRSINF
jgi:ATP-dependent Clp protease ATP-binding subunit ClpX